MLRGTFGTTADRRLVYTLGGITEMINMTHTHTLSTGKHHLSPFWRHFLQMLGVMMVGMIGSGAILLTFVGLKTWDEVTT